MAGRGVKGMGDPVNDREAQQNPYIHPAAEGEDGKREGMEDSQGLGQLL